MAVALVNAINKIIFKSMQKGSLTKCTFGDIDLKGNCRGPLCPLCSRIVYHCRTSFCVFHCLLNP